MPTRSIPRSITIESMPTTQQATGSLPGDKGQCLIEVTVRYDEGGINYATYQNKPRGYYVSVSPIERGVSAGGCEYTRFGLFSGVSRFQEPATRFSAKALAKVAEKLKADKSYEDLIHRVLEKNGITIAEPELPLALEPGYHDGVERAIALDPVS